MNADHVNLRRLQALDCWTGPIEVEPLAGGITNQNYRVRVGGESFFARFCTPRPLLGIDRRNEVVCQRAAHALGVAPRVVHDADGVFISAFLEARTLSPVDVRDPAFVPRLAAVLGTLHGGCDRLDGEALYFSVFGTIATYAGRARALGAGLPADLDDLVNDARGLARQIGPFVPALCHNDLLAANVLDDGRRVWLVDWEYAGMGHPLFDLAGVSANSGFTDDLDAALLTAYRGTVAPNDLRELRILKAMSLLRESLWSSIQTVASGIAFDYGAYASSSYRAYREARRAIAEDG